MISMIWGFFETYGWLLVLSAGIGYALYTNVVLPKLNVMRAESEMVNRKKYDTSVHSKISNDLEKVRLRQQEEHNLISEELKAKHDQKRAEKLAEIMKEKKASSSISNTGKIPLKKNSPGEIIDAYIASKPIVMFSKSWCPFCRKAKALLATFRLSDAHYEYIELDERDDCEEIQQEFIKRYGSRSVPKVFISGEYIGGCDDTVNLNNQGVLEVVVEQAINSFKN